MNEYVLQLPLPPAPSPVVTVPTTQVLEPVVFVHDVDTNKTGNGDACQSM
jgi:hypothetical protein